MEEKKDIMKKKSYYIIGIISVVVIIILVGFMIFFNNRKKDIVNDVNVTFSGYNKNGKAELVGKFKDNEKSIIAKKVGYSDSDVEAIKNGNDKVIDSDYTKVGQFEKYMKDTTIKLNKNRELSNGEQLTLSINTTLKDNPIKTSKKTFTVSGLKKSKIYTLEQALKQYPVKITGYNHFGKLDYNSNLYTINKQSKSDNMKLELENGDSVKVAVSDVYLTQASDKGYIIQGDKTTTIKVSGLSDSPKISNINELLNQIDSMVKNEKQSNQFDSYTISRQDSYFIGKNISEYHSNSEGFSVVSIYKIDYKNTLSDSIKTKYYVYGYEDLKLSGEKVDISSLTDNDIYGTEGDISDSAKLAYEGLKSAYPSLIKLN